MNRNRDSENAPTLKTSKHPSGTEDAKQLTPSGTAEQEQTHGKTDPRRTPAPATATNGPADQTADNTPPDAANLQTIGAEAATIEAEAQEPTQKRKRKTTSSETKRKYNKSNYDTLQINISKGGRAAIHAAAAAAGMSTTAYIIAAVNAYAEHEIVKPLARNPYI